ncbi:MAG: YgjV family protein [Firmicutes bacterium]|nr:YgjV family protein [Bacillota bacterium]
MYVILVEMGLGERILRSLQFDNWLWWLSQVFALIALISFIWSFQIKDKIKMMMLIGHASTSLVVSAAILGNFTLAVLFGLAAIRNYVFSYTDTRKKKGKHVAKWIPYVFAGVFATATITATVLFMTVFRVEITQVYNAVHGGYSYINFAAPGSENAYRMYIEGYGYRYVYLTRWDGGFMTPNYVRGVPISFWWVEVFICATLIGLIIGNILPGTLVMRLSFIANRGFNIVNHLIFGNIIGVVIAATAIGSNLLFYIRMLQTHLKKKKRLAGAGPEELEQIRLEEQAAKEAKAISAQRVLSPEVVIKKEVIRKLLPTPFGKPKKVKNEAGEEVEIIEETFEECDVEVCTNSETGEIISEEIIARHGEAAKD